MSFLGKLKSAFGFSDTGTEIEEEFNRPGTVTQLRVKPYVETPHKGVEPQKKPVPKNAPEYPDAVPQQIFTSVVKIFNDSLPDFLKSSVDQKAQEKLIYDSLDDSMKAYIASLEEIAQKRTEFQYQQEREHLKAEMESIKDKTKRMESTNAEWKEQKLSAERQKRALSQRVQDLEQRIETLEAEREQFDIENKSLVNKIRVMTTQEGDVKLMREDNEALRAEVNRLRAQLVSNTSGESDTNDNVLRTEIEHLQQQLNENVAKIAEHEAVIAQLNEEKLKLETTISQFDAEKKSIEAEKADIQAEKDRIQVEKEDLLKERESLLSDIDTLKTRCDFSDEMLNDLNRKASAARIESQASQSELEDKAREHSELQQRVESLELELIKKEEALQDYIDETSRLSDQVSSYEQELEDANSALQMFDSTIEKFEALKKSKDEKIAKLEKQLEEKDASVSAEQSTEIQSLKDTIKNNLMRHAESESALRTEIDQLKKTISELESKSSYVADNSTDYDGLDDINWLVANPGTLTPQGLTDEEFGYHEPKRQKPNDNPAQMSLF